MCYSPALRQDRVTGPGWGRDGKANGEDFLQEEEEGKSECVWEKGKVDCDEEWPCQGLVGRAKHRARTASLGRRACGACCSAHAARRVHGRHGRPSKDRASLLAN